MTVANNFIFIIGCGHSGTTVLNKIIGNHKDVFGIDNETSLFFRDPHNINCDLKKYSNTKIKLKKQWTCEKTPTHVYKIDEIYKYVSNPKIIVMTRDGRDVVSSLFKRYGDIDKSANRWINDNNEWLNHPNKSDFCVIKYEDFVNDPNKIINKICDYIGIEYYDDIINYPKIQISKPTCQTINIDNEDHNKLRKYQVNQDIYDGTGRYLKDLTQEQLNYIYQFKNFNLIMTKLNYE